MSLTSTLSAPQQESNAPKTDVKQSLATPTGIPLRNISKLSLKDVPDLENKDYEHADLLPSYPDVDWPPLEDVEVKDAAIGADPEYKKLFSSASKVEHLTPKIGTVLHGTQLNELDDDQKKELALLAAYRGVVFFKNQEHFDVDKQLELGKFYGPLHRHPLTAIPKGWNNGTDEKTKDWDAIHVVYAAPNKVAPKANASTFYWHSDITYERQPASYTILKLLTGPPADTGGGADTLWVSTYGLYDLLSPSMREYLEGLTAIHSSVEQSEESEKIGRHVRRKAVTSEHPVIRTHPVTGYKSLYVTPPFTSKLTGVPGAESQAVLKYLFELIATATDIRVKYKWSKNDVAIWDNRIVNHTASYSYFPYGKHAIRVAAQGEKPYLDKTNGRSQQDALDEYYGGKGLQLDGSKAVSFSN